MKIYIAGPITGMQDRNAPAFAAAALYLRECGHEVVSPLEVNPPGSCTSWEDAMQKDIPHLLTCQGIALLPGWERSKGARLELQIADAFRMMRVILPR